MRVPTRAHTTCDVGARNRAGIGITSCVIDITRCMGKGGCGVLAAAIAVAGAGAAVASAAAADDDTTAVVVAVVVDADDDAAAAADDDDDEDDDDGGNDEPWPSCTPRCPCACGFSWR